MLFSCHGFDSSSRNLVAPVGLALPLRLPCSVPAPHDAIAVGRPSPCYCVAASPRLHRSPIYPVVLRLCDVGRSAGIGRTSRLFFYLGLGVDRLAAASPHCRSSSCSRSSDTTGLTWLKTKQASNSCGLDSPRRDAALSSKQHSLSSSPRAVLALVARHSPTTHFGRILVWGEKHRKRTGLLDQDQDQYQGPKQSIAHETDPILPSVPLHSIVAVRQSWHQARDQPFWT